MTKFGCQLLMLLLLNLLLGCNNGNNNQPPSILFAGDKPAAVSTIAIDSITAKFDLLEALFKNENWLLIQGRDSSFVYCSRLSKKYCRTYYYRMLNGDSTATVASEIKLSGIDIVWQAPPVGNVLRLAAITATSVKWNDNNGGVYTFQKTDSSNIQISQPHKAPLQLKRTITLASFLVKSKYDHKHGTKLAYENSK